MYSTADALFAKTFRTPAPPLADDQPLDRLSLLAATRQGILPADILPQPRESFSCGAKLVADARFEAFEQRRQQKCRIIERERRKIISTLLRSYHETGSGGSDDEEEGSASFEFGRAERRSPGPAKADVLSADEERLMTQLHKQVDESGGKHLPVVSLVPAEEELIAAFCERGDTGDERGRRLREAARAILAQGDAALAKLKSRQLRGVAAEVRTEAQRQQMSAAMQRKEAMLAEMREARDEALRRRREEEDRVARRKARERQRRAEAVAAARVDELRARSAARDAATQRINEARELEAARRRAELEEQARIASERVKAVDEEREARALLLGEEVMAKLQLHGSRKTNLDLGLRARLEAQAALARHRAAQALDAVARANADDREGGPAEVRAATEAALAAAAARKRAADEEISRELEERSAARRRQQQRALDNIAAADAARTARAAEVLRELDEQDEGVRQARDAKRAHTVLLAELAAQRRANHEDNKERLRRVFAYEQRIKDAVIAEREAVQEARERARSRTRERMVRTRLAIAREREDIIMTVERLRHRPLDSSLAGATSSNDDEVVGALQREIEKMRATPQPAAAMSASRSPTRAASAPGKRQPETYIAPPMKGSHAGGSAVPPTRSSGAASTPLSEMARRLNELYNNAAL